MSVDKDKRKFLNINPLFMLFIFFVLGFVFGLMTFYLISLRGQSEEPQFVLSRDTVVERVSEQGFLVTRVAVVDEQVTINVDEGSAWSNFWWGHEVDAQSRIQVDIGVDLSEVEAGDINVNEDEKTITIDIPDSEIYNISLQDEITVSTKSGILKKIFNSDDNEDYNLALRELEESTRESILLDQELFKDAEADVADVLSGLFAGTGYELTVE
jgi:hypothetical protein